MMHDIEELRRQYEQANSRCNDAQIALEKAKDRLKAALVEATGLIGKKVQSRGKMIIVDDLYFVPGSWKHLSVTGRVIKKDGALGLRKDTFFDWKVIEEETNDRPPLL